MSDLGSVSWFGPLDDGILEPPMGTMAVLNVEALMVSPSFLRLKKLNLSLKQFIGVPILLELTLYCGSL